MVAALASVVVTVYMQYEAWTTSRRWRPIIGNADTVLRKVDQEANGD
jgi:hypothetical protein